MYIDHISLLDYRTYALLSLPLSAGVTVFLGSNGVGKTNIVEARKFRDLVGNIVTVYGFDGGSKLFGQTHVFFQTALIFFGHGRMIRRLDIERSQCAMKSFRHTGTRLHDPQV